MLINSCVLIVPVDVRVCVYSVVRGGGGDGKGLYTAVTFYISTCVSGL